MLNTVTIYCCICDSFCICVWGITQQIYLNNCKLLYQKYPCCFISISQQLPIKKKRQKMVFRRFPRVKVSPEAESRFSSLKKGKRPNLFLKHSKVKTQLPMIFSMIAVPLLLLGLATSMASKDKVRKSTN